MSLLVSLQDVSKEYRDGGNVVLALNTANLSLDQGQDMVIMGPSGSGKSTLLQIIGGLDKPTSGRVSVGGRDLTHLDDAALAVFRNRTIGFVFQTFNLQSYATALENVALPLLLAGQAEKTALPQAAELLKRVGLADRAKHRPEQMSGGEMQRVAVARALVNNPQLILADEPTGNLDKANAVAILDLFAELSDDSRSFVIVTHDERVASRYQRVVQIENGEIKSDGGHHGTTA